MKVEWQVYSTSQARVVARVPTEGEHLLVKAVDGGNHVLLQGAFAQNVQKLVASESFRNALSGPTAASIPPPGAALAALRVAYRPAAAPVAFDQAARGVVSIFAGQGMGSGVLISADGYILTNHHVAGEAGRVRVRWADGTDTPGEVVRADRGRDVALIKTTAKTAPLGIRTAPVKLGETVYAIGTPKERDFAGTLTRGVVSSPKRVLDGRSYIQSDVAITNGNSGGALIDEKGGLVGLSVAGYAPGGVPLGINFFIPIEEALQSLALTPAG
ncbi:S1C family serine protease [Phenylobacterium sp. J367]|uniref:S1C family serine protease n=1 Tax=Phenylobacterium sp. J367 TaxID=2898435 RepID=UPI0021515EF6|nr:S1C family serine protease [Phenylobacterium sp. J367]MCR5877474.1 S1C family serine protease [Phenylobacterium sp. J367]